MLRICARLSPLSASYVTGSLFTTEDTETQRKKTFNHKGYERPLTTKDTKDHEVKQVHHHVPSWYFVSFVVKIRFPLCLCVLCGEKLSGGTAKGFFGGDNGIAVDGHRVFDMPRVSARERHHHGNIALARHPKHQLIAPLQALDGEAQTAEL